MFRWIGFEQDYEAFLSRYIQMRDDIHHARSHQVLQMSNAHLQTMSVTYSRIRDSLDELLNTEEVYNIFSA